MREELLDQARRAVQMSLDAGADDVVAGVSWGRSLELQWRDGKLEKIQENTTRSLGVSLYLEGRYSSHATNDLEPGRLRRFLAEALALTRCLEPDPYRAIPDPRLYEGRAEVDLDLADPQVIGLSTEQRQEWCQALEEQARSHPEIISATSGVLDGHGISARASSNGFAGTDERTSLWYGAEVTARDGETKRPEASRWVGATHRALLPDPEGIGAEARERVLARRGAAKIPGRRTAMVVQREAAAGLLGRVFGALGAGAIQQKRSFLANKLNARIAAPLLSVEDDPLIPRSLGSRLYDGEGIAARRRAVLEEGVLRTYFVDTYYGRKLGWEPTTARPSNVLLQLGSSGEKELIRAAGEGFLVTSWLGGNANMTSGDFSFGFQGHAIRAGERAEPVAEMNITGNYLDLLEKLVLVGDDPEPWAVVRTPTLVFENIDFSGA